jgi:hypothetical protein
MRDTITITVPARFWEDHLDRGCRCHEACPDRAEHEGDGGYGTLTSKGYRVELTGIDAQELASDARHYSNAVQMMGSDYIGLQSSARATVRRLAGS